MNRFLKGVVAASAAVLLLIGVLVQSGVAFNIEEQKTLRRVNVDELFKQNCVSCHGAAGRGDTPLGRALKSPDFTAAEWWKENSSRTSPRALRLVVSRGRGTMPAFGKKLTKSEINLLVNRLRSFRK
jgi:mono/diheme cytochrome c family protein